MKKEIETTWIVEQAKRLGFDLCGVVRAEKFPELQRAEEWLARGYAGEMKYLADERRAEPARAMEGVRSAVVCGLNYKSALPRTAEAVKSAPDEMRGWISRYAWGRDYHEVMREKLQRLAETLDAECEAVHESRVYVDTGPVNERILAKHAGLGWIGKNTLLLNAKMGSWFFLGVILTTMELAPSLGAAEAPPADLCGTCTRCLEACPTEAFVEPYVMDARRCISYLTIEYRGSIAADLREGMGPHVFGCDICQDVCPWNRRAPVTDAEEFQPRTIRIGARSASTGAERADDEGEESESLFLPRLEWLAGMTEEEFRAAFRGSPIKRAKWRGLVRNACIALGNSRVARDCKERGAVGGLLERLAESQDAVISESARWALSRIQEA
ncbi:MAG TPA: tRNA epoxyqueuosine(34) reductase QueG [Candidatus Acidoferrum sp.]|nr:tRNA epoxyqueuosine(34) reductase QueG [Candidatus Acidoferrum sp.]